MMWRNVQHPVLRSPLAKSGTMADMDVLKGHTASFGPPNTGANGSNRVMLESLGYMLEDDFERAKARAEALDAELNDMLDNMVAEQVNPMPADYKHWVLGLKPYQKWVTLTAVEKAAREWKANNPPEELRDRINKGEQQQVALATEHSKVNMHLLLARAEWRTIPEDVQKFLIEGNWANEEEFNRELNQAMWSGVRWDGKKI
mgnify:CR=1 FL=1